MALNQVTKELFYEKVSEYIKDEKSLILIQKAYDFAYEAHKNQKRKSGEPYFIHLLNVAYELALLKAGPKTICAGFLHDSMEDQGVTKEILVQEFDEEIFTLVEAVTKITNIEFKDEKEYQAANHRKILLAMAKDIRVVLIKLVDRLHNMRTLEFQSPIKQKQKSNETLNVYAPIAHRLGIAEIEHELENLSLYYLDRDAYDNVVELLNNKKSEREAQINRMIEEISKILKQNNIEFRIFGRAKDIYSIYKKMQTKNKRFDEILDLLAIRIITKTELNCYEILGFIHAAYHPIPGRFKDYIAMPKVNMYQSLHTTLVGSDGRIYEVQIRTEEMDEIAEKGVAAHWSYKEGKDYSAKNEQKEIQKELEWLKDFEDDYTMDNPSEYMSSISHDVFNANIYVMTPKGRVIDLVNGATPIDFAYRVHTEVGHQTVGAIVNGVMVPLNTALKTGDVVELKTDKKSGPSEDWLKIVKTSNAKNKIKSYLQKRENERREALIVEGEKIFKDDLKRRGLLESDFMDERKLDQLYQAFQLSNYNDLMYAIACKSLSMPAIADRLIKQKKNEVSQDFIETITRKNREKRKGSLSKKNGIKVGGIDSMKTELASCCSPIYGDQIVGYVSKGHGIKIHRRDCPNVINEKRRLIDADWDESSKNINYEVDIRIYAKDRNFLLTDLVTCVSQYKSSLMSVTSNVNPLELTATTNLTITVNDLEHLETIMANLRKVTSVISVERIIK